MSKSVQDLTISEFDGFERVAAIIAGRPLFHFSIVHSFHYFGRCEDESGDPQTLAMRLEKALAGEKRLALMSPIG